MDDSFVRFFQRVAGGILFSYFFAFAFPLAFDIKDFHQNPKCFIVIRAFFTDNPVIRHRALFLLSPFLKPAFVVITVDCRINGIQIGDKITFYYFKGDLKAAIQINSGEQRFKCPR